MTSEIFFKNSNYLSDYIADMTVPSRTPARYPKNTTDNAAAISTNETSQYGLTFPNSFFNTFAIATINPSPER